MAKKQPAPKSRKPAPPSSPALASLADLAADAANPRDISEESAEGLRNSIKRFGDLSGIVFNKRTGELVAGHQRVNQIRAEFGDALAIEPINEAASLFGIRVSAEQYFPVRVVDWSTAMQRAANVAANNPRIQGKFTGELSTYLLSMQAEIDAELPGILDDCLMVDLLAVDIDQGTAEQITLTPTYQVVIECPDEENQRKTFEKLTKQGHRCKVLTA